MEDQGSTSAKFEFGAVAQPAERPWSSERLVATKNERGTTEHPQAEAELGKLHLTGSAEPPHIGAIEVCEPQDELGI